MFTENAPVFFKLCPNCEDYIIDDSLWCYNDECCINCCPPDDQDDEDQDMDDQEEPE